MGIVLTNAILVDIDPIRVEAGGLRIEGNTITARGIANPQPHDVIIDCNGAVVLPGLVNGHTHLYSALAVGMPAPPRHPTSFLEILELVWWRLDQALDERSNEMSAQIGALDALHCGTTTLIDHHASPRVVHGSLDAIERGISSIGLRGVLCYETTDRHGLKGREAGLEENRRYLRKCAEHNAGVFAGFVGAHASFTLDDDSLAALATIAQDSHTGVHIHVAEDRCDEKITRQRYGKSLIDRLDHHGLLLPSTLFAHCIHLSSAEIAQVNGSKLHIAHNPRSNMNNAVGYAPVGEFTCPVQLGTDGIGADMFVEAKTAWFKSRDSRTSISPDEIIEMLANSARRASTALKVKLGVLDVGAAADVVVTDYVPFSPLTGENLSGHVLFAIGAQNVRHVIINGRLALNDRVAQTCDEPALRAHAHQVASGLWKRMETIPA